eukprot:458956-Prymnesium_polylepis.1
MGGWSSGARPAAVRRAAADGTLIACRSCVDCPPSQNLFGSSAPHSRSASRHCASLKVQIGASVKT